MFPDGDEDPDGDPGALLPVDVEEVGALALVHAPALQPGDLCNIIQQ